MEERKEIEGRASTAGDSNLSGAAGVGDTDRAATGDNAGTAAGAVTGDSAGAAVNPFIDRELSWLSFNRRVLMEADDPKVPLLERLKFISIYFSNLDEFFMVRIGSLLHRSAMFPQQRDAKTGWSPAEQLRQALDAAAGQQQEVTRLYRHVLAELRSRNIDIINFAKISQVDELLAKKYFGELRPLLSPQVVDGNHPFPFLQNKEQYVVSTLDTGKSEEMKIGIVPLWKLPPYYMFSVDGCRKIALTNELVRHFAALLYKKHTVIESVTIRVTRNADILLSEQRAYDVDFRSTMEKALRKRKRQQPVRLQFSGHPSGRLKSYLVKKLNLSARYIFTSTLPCDFSFGSSLTDKLKDEVDEGYGEQKPSKGIELKKGELFRYLENRDLLLCFPYQSINPFVELLYEAADSPDVVSIKITLYRLAGSSKVAAALAYAAERGKDVFCLLELRARFDEQSNIDYSKMLEDAGCRIIYGLDEYKVHSKLCLITRKSGDKVHYITQVGTGNYNEVTAELYTDLSLITGDSAVGRDAAEIFTSLSLGTVPEPAENLWVAPDGYKTRLIDMIASQAALGADGYVAVKANSMNDIDVMRAMIAASQAGCTVELFIRGICCLLPELPGLTDNVHIKSIVGRYLEHSRIFVFGRGQFCRVFIGSGDLLLRNTERRVELFVELGEPETREAVLEIMRAAREDDVKGWLMQSDGQYIKDRQGSFDSQQFLYKYFSNVSIRAEKEKEHRFGELLKKLFRRKI